MTRIGKIARLPQEIREQVNDRLADGEPGPQLLTWLNARPETQEMLKRYFGGRPVSEQNLSEWRQGGHQDWLNRRELEQRLRDLDRHHDDLYDEVVPRLAGDLWHMLGARTALTIQQCRPTGDTEADTRALKSLTELVAHLRRSQGEAEQTHLEERKFNVERRKVELEERLLPEKLKLQHEQLLAFLRHRPSRNDAASSTQASHNGKTPSSQIQADQGESR